MSKARIFIVRHGETDANKNGVIQGHLDTSLNAVGRSQAELVAFALQQIPFDYAYSSDLSRAASTAEAILKHHSGLQVTKQTELREANMGKLQGLNLAQRAQLLAKPNEKVDLGIESDKSMSQRAEGWWKQSIVQLLDSLPARDEPYRILVVSHGGFIGTLVKKLLRSGQAKCGQGVLIYRIFNASITEIEAGGGSKALIVRYGDIGHLDGQKLVEQNVDEDK
ncbi:hypothetical protein HGRIS_012760 [Hohenbuehelia grisea]|uniref:Phosphoglycerate mutase n=1 Tax=Hohenbuehelia grisea TaxID=104357 RepID=A0ABR3ITA9_9AGAR